MDIKVTAKETVYQENRERKK